MTTKAKASTIDLGGNAGDLVFQSSANVTSTLPLGTSGKVLISNGSAPAWGDGLPAGLVAHFANSTPPSGWLKCNGAAVSRTTYAALFTAIGTLYGSGDGSTTFNLPDLRGEFVRGFDDGRGVDSGRSIGSAQDSQMQSHTHGIQTYYGPNESSGQNGVAGVFAASISNQYSTFSAGGTSNSSENRPRNIAMLACIKH